MPSFLRITSSLNLLKFYSPVLNNLYKEINDLNKEKILIKKIKKLNLMNQLSFQKLILNIQILLNQFLRFKF